MPVDRLTDQKKTGGYFFFDLLDGIKAGQLRHMCGNACWIVGWLEKKRDSVFFLACWMDWRLARFDICVENPVGSLDDQKKNGTYFFETDHWMVGWPKKNGGGFFF